MEHTIQKIICPLDGVSASLWGHKNGYNLYQCFVCKLVFVWPLPSPEHIYAEDYFSGATHGFGYVDYDVDKRPMIPVFETYLDLFENFSEKPRTLFDVGAASGFFLQLAKKRGYDVSGVEMSDYAATMAREKGLDVRTGDMLDQNVSAEQYSIVTMLDVVEHMTDPCAELREAYRILKPGGLLAINTPNGQSLLARVLKSHWHLVVPPEHLFYFSPQNLGQFLEENGFSIIHSSNIGKRFTFSYIFKTLYKWQKFSIWNRVADFFSTSSRHGWSIPVNLYDNFFLIAQKK